ncbi:hypothetical protein RQP46_009367 [Phenoliferia psychrophenolica]
MLSLKNASPFIYSNVGVLGAFVCSPFLVASALSLEGLSLAILGKSVFSQQKPLAKAEPAPALATRTAPAPLPILPISVKPVVLLCATDAADVGIDAVGSNSLDSDSSARTSALIDCKSSSDIDQLSDLFAKFGSDDGEASTLSASESDDVSASAPSSRESSPMATSSSCSSSGSSASSATSQSGSAVLPIVQSRILPPIAVLHPISAPVVATVAKEVAKPKVATPKVAKAKTSNIPVRFCRRIASPHLTASALARHLHDGDFALSLVCSGSQHAASLLYLRIDDHASSSVRVVNEEHEAAEKAYRIAQINYHDTLLNSRDGEEVKPPTVPPHMRNRRVSDNFIENTPSSTNSKGPAAMAVDADGASDDGSDDDSDEDRTPRVIRPLPLQRRAGPVAVPAFQSAPVAVATVPQAVPQGVPSPQAVPQASAAASVSFPQRGFPTVPLDFSNTPAAGMAVDAPSFPTSTTFPNPFYSAPPHTYIPTPSHFDSRPALPRNTLSTNSFSDGGYPSFSAFSSPFSFSSPSMAASPDATLMNSVNSRAYNKPLPSQSAATPTPPPAASLPYNGNKAFNFGNPPRDYSDLEVDEPSPIDIDAILGEDASIFAEVESHYPSLSPPVLVSAEPSSTSNIAPSGSNPPSFAGPSTSAPVRSPAMMLLDKLEAEGEEEDEAPKRSKMEELRSRRK